MTRGAPARTGALIAIGLAACSSHVDVGFSLDGGALARPEAGEASGGQSDAGVTWVRPRGWHERKWVEVGTSPARWPKDGTKHGSAENER
jgi:hypothetical protein